MKRCRYLILVLGLILSFGVAGASHASDFSSDNDHLGEPPDPSVQAWLIEIPESQGTGASHRYSYLPLISVQRQTSFWADEYRLEPGECTGLHWQSIGVRQVFLDGLEVALQGTLQVCPSATTEYRLTVVQTSGIKDYHRLAILVGGDDAWFGVTGDGNFYRGNLGATVRLEEFMDFQCPYCVRHALQTGPLLDEAYIATGEVVEVFRNLPLDIHPGAVPAAKAAYCAGQQRPAFFWSLHDWLLQNQESWNQDSQPATQFRAAALRLGVDILRYDACLVDPTTEAHLQRDVQEAHSREVRGTPAFFINSCALSGALPFERFRDTIEKAKQGLCIPSVDFFDSDPARPGLTIDGSPTRGAADARIVLISYEDFKNIGSAQHVLTIEPALSAKYVAAGQMRLVYACFADTAPRAAVAALCAARQDKFWEFRSLLYQERANWTEYVDHDDPIMRDYAASLGLDTVAFDGCLIDPSARSQVDAYYQFARDQIGVPYAPSFLLIHVNQAGVVEAVKALVGPQTLEAIVQAIRELLSN